MLIDFSGKTALVCGASQGIGASVARQLAAANCTVIVLARRAAVLVDLV